MFYDGGVFFFAFGVGSCVQLAVLNKGPPCLAQFKLLNKAHDTWFRNQSHKSTPYF